jgi:hypothetical protein
VKSETYAATLKRTDSPETMARRWQAEASVPKVRA